jgi:serine O-acetyltransferase
MSLCPRLARDFRRYREIQGWGVARTLIDALFLSSGFQSLMAYRLAHSLKKLGIPVVPALLRRLSIAFCAIDILPQARIGGGCYLPHSPGIVIGGTSVIGQDCTLLQGVTLGEARFSETACPTIGDRVVLGVGATLLGGIHIGEDSFVGAGAVVLEDVPARHIAVGVPATSRPIDASTD